jgi:hypothetical protein
LISKSKRRPDMKYDSILKILILWISILLVISFTACKTTGGRIHVGWGPDSKGTHVSYPHNVKKGGPPPHAPAHGYRAKYTYRYYPSSCVYYDTGRKVYFYLQGDDWRASVSLPQHLNLRLGNYVTMDMDTDKPYTRFEEHRHKYPPGQLKKKNKNWARY